MIPLYGVEAHGGRIITMDDEAVVKDLADADGSGGTAYAPFLTSTPFDAGVGGWSTLRRVVQHVHPDGAVSIDITPIRDQNESGQVISRDIATGENFVVTAPMQATGTTFSVKITLSDFDAAAELGKAEQWVVPRRSGR
jgi:hypothetical protein